jgi:hypothetical protein
MPIRPENKDRYPKNWSSEIVPRIRKRSGGRCECRGECGKKHSGRCGWRNGAIKESGAKIVLTVAHLDHQPEHCDDANLLHMCQGCHNRYDASTRRAGIQARARAKRASGDLFECVEAP